MLIGVFVLGVPAAAVLIGMKLYDMAMESGPGAADVAAAASAQPAAAQPAPANAAETDPDDRKADRGKARPKPEVVSAPLAQGSVIEGDRVAWLDDAGNGFARHANGWVYHGDADDVPFHSGSGTVQFGLVETMRNKSHVELFDPDSRARVRIDSKEAVMYPAKAGSGEHRLRDGDWKNSNGEAGWRASAHPTFTALFPWTSAMMTDCRT